MGLTVVRDIVARHDGMMVVDSTVGQGTCFDAYLPHMYDRIKADAIWSKSIQEENERPVVDKEFISCQHVQKNMQYFDCCILAQLRS